MSGFKEFSAVRYDRIILKDGDGLEQVIFPVSFRLSDVFRYEKSSIDNGKVEEVNGRYQAPQSPACLVKLNDGSEFRITMPYEVFKDLMS